MGNPDSKPISPEVEVNSKEVYKINDEWEMFKDLHLGDGLIGEVYKGRNIKTGKLVAVKIIKLSKFEDLEGIYD